MIYKLHKIFNIVYLLAIALVLVATCAFMTQYNYIPTPSRQDFADACNAANTTMLLLVIVGLVGLAILNILGNSSRKKMYISNIIAGEVIPVVTIGLSIYVISLIAKCISIFNEHYDELKAYDDQFNLDHSYNYNTTGFNFAMIMVIIFIVVLVIYAVLNFLKYKQNHYVKAKVEEVGVTDAK